MRSGGEGVVVGTEYPCIYMHPPYHTYLYAHMHTHGDAHVHMHIISCCTNTHIILMDLCASVLAFWHQKYLGQINLVHSVYLSKI